MTSIGTLSANSSSREPAINQARRTHNAMIDERPALIVRCRDAQDVA